MESNYCVMDGDNLLIIISYGGEPLKFFHEIGGDSHGVGMVKVQLLPAFLNGLAAFQIDSGRGVPV